MSQKVLCKEDQLPLELWPSQWNELNHVIHVNGEPYLHLLDRNITLNEC